MPRFDHDGISFHYAEAGDGAGLPFLFQHGLGGDVGQPFGVLPPPPGSRLLGFDCRGHGATQPLGPPDAFTPGRFAEDAFAFLDHLGVDVAVVGGISMGAAVALRMAISRPERVAGLVLSRPAWLDRPWPANTEIYRDVVALIRRHGAARGLEVFLDSPAYQRVAAMSSDAAASLVGQFEQPRAEEALVRLERLPASSPCSSLSELATIGVPALVLATRLDPIHPYEYGPLLAEAMPKATFVEVTAKSVSRERHATDVQAAVGGFLATLHPPHRLEQEAQQ